MKQEEQEALEKFATLLDYFIQKKYEYENLFREFSNANYNIYNDKVNFTKISKELFDFFYQNYELLKRSVENSIIFKEAQKSLLITFFDNIWKHSRSVEYYSYISTVFEKINNFFKKNSFESKIILNLDNDENVAIDLKGDGEIINSILNELRKQMTELQHKSEKDYEDLSIKYNKLKDSLKSLKEEKDDKEIKELKKEITNCLISLLPFLNKILLSWRIGKATQKYISWKINDEENNEEKSKKEEK